MFKAIICCLLYLSLVAVVMAMKTKERKGATNYDYTHHTIYNATFFPGGKDCTNVEPDDPRYFHWGIRTPPGSFRCNNVLFVPRNLPVDK